MLLKFLCKRFGAIDAVENPKRMLEFRSELISGEWELFLRGQCIKKLRHALVVDKASVLRLEELVQVERILLRLAVDLDTALSFVTDDFGHLVGEEVQAGQFLIRIVFVRGSGPFTLCLLFVGVCPVVDLVVGKLVVGKCLERSA